MTAKPIELCGAKTRHGGTCRHEAGWGTSHPAQGRCKLHGGATPNHDKAAMRARAEEAVQTFGLPREVDPHTALLEEVWRTAGHVAWLQGRLAELDVDALTFGKSKVVLGIGDEVEPEKTELSAGANVLLRIYQGERDHLVKVCDTAIRAGVAERQIQLAEEQAQEMAAILTLVLGDLGLDLADPKVEKVVKFRLLEGGRGDEEQAA